MDDLTKRATELMKETKAYTVSPSFVLPPTDPFWYEERERVVGHVSALHAVIEALLHEREVML